MEKTKDFFISYNTADKQWATWIAATLEGEGYSTVIQAWDFRPGNNFVIQMKKAIDQCKKMIAVLSNRYIESRYCQAEWSASFRLDPTGEERKTIFVRIEDTPLPKLMAPYIYIDLVGKDESTAASLLIQGVSEKPIQRTKPEFPGIKESKPSPQEDSKLSLSITIEKDGSAKLSSITARNNLREWFFGTRSKNYDIKIEDKRSETVEPHLAPITSKIENGHNLTPEEEKVFQICTRQLKKWKTDAELKKFACTYFLDDSVMQGALHIGGISELEKFLVDLVGLDYYNDKQKKLNDRKYELLNFSITLSPKEKYCFTAPLERKLLIEDFGEDLSILAFEYADKLRLTLLKEASIYYYFFLAELFYYDGNDKLVPGGANANLLNYKIGVY